VVGDVGAVSDVARGAGHAAAGADGGRASGHGDGGVVDGPTDGERADAVSKFDDSCRIEPGRDRVGERDGAGEQLRHGGLHAGGAAGRHGVRVDGLDVGDVGAVSDERRREADVEGGTDGGGASGHGDGGVVDGPADGERADAGEPGRDRVGERDGAGVEPGAGGLHVGGAAGRHGVRVD